MKAATIVKTMAVGGTSVTAAVVYFPFSVGDLSSTYRKLCEQFLDTPYKSARGPLLIALKRARRRFHQERIVRLAAARSHRRAAVLRRGG